MTRDLTTHPKNGFVHVLVKAVGRDDEEAETAEQQLEMAFPGLEHHTVYIATEMLLMDVPERELKEAFQLGDSDAVAAAVAKMFAREMRLWHAFAQQAGTGDHITGLSMPMFEGVSDVAPVFDRQHESVVQALEKYNSKPLGRPAGKAKVGKLAKRCKKV